MNANQLTALRFVQECLETGKVKDASREVASLIASAELEASRNTGRSFRLMLDYLKQASLAPGVWFDVRDHYNTIEAGQSLLRAICHVLEEFQVRFEAVEHERRFRILG